MFIKENNTFTLPYVEAKENERISTKIYNFMKEKFNINSTLIIENPWCLAFNKDYKMLKFIPDFPKELEAEFLAIPIVSVEDPKNSFWIPINEANNYNLTNETLKIITILKNLIGVEEVINEFCG